MTWPEGPMRGWGFKGGAAQRAPSLSARRSGESCHCPSPPSPPQKSPRICRNPVAMPIDGRGHAPLCPPVATLLRGTQCKCHLKTQELIAEHGTKANPFMIKSPHPDPNDFQNVMQTFCPMMHLWQNFHENPISGFYVKLQTDRQTDRQTHEQTPGKT